MEQYIGLIVGLILVLGLIGFSILRKHLDDEKRLRLRQMIHEERMAAMEKEMEVPALDGEIERSLLATGAPAPPRANGSIKGLLWVRLTALCVGWFMLFAGIGMAFSFSLTVEDDVKNIWAVGFIPAMAGVGLLLFYHLSRDYADRFAALENGG